MYVFVNDATGTLRRELKFDFIGNTFYNTNKVEVDRRNTLHIALYYMNSSLTHFNFMPSCLYTYLVY